MMERLGEMFRLVCSSSRVNGRRPSHPDGIFLLFGPNVLPETSARNFGPKFRPETSARLADQDFVLPVGVADQDI